MPASLLWWPVSSQGEPLGVSGCDTLKDYYRVLGVDRGSSQEDMKKAFRGLAARHHPERNPQDWTQAEARFKGKKRPFTWLASRPGVDSMTI